MKDPDEVQPPGSDRLLIILRVEKSRNCISFALFDDLPLDPRHGPEVRPIASLVKCSKRVFLA